MRCKRYRVQLKLEHAVYRRPQKHCPAEKHQKIRQYGVSPPQDVSKSFMLLEPHTKHAYYTHTEQLTSSDMYGKSVFAMWSFGAFPFLLLATRCRQERFMRPHPQTLHTACFQMV
jgi:hypothetical protein